MERYFTKTFYRFFFSFLTIIAVAFGVLLTTSALIPDTTQVTANPHDSQ